MGLAGGKQTDGMTDGETKVLIELCDCEKKCRLTLSTWRTVEDENDHVQEAP